MSTGRRVASTIDDQPGRWPPRPLNPAWWGVIGLLIHVGIVLILFATGSRPASFVHFGEGGAATPLARQVLGPGVPVHPGGGDGVAFWALARDPGLGHVAAHLDRPSYRADRIGYPLVAAPWRIFGEGGLLWGLIVTNLVFAAVGTWAAAAIARLVGAPGRAALAFALCPGVTASTWLDVCDGMALALVLVTVLYALRRRWALAAIAAVAATLTKEVALVPLAGVLLLGPGLGTWRRRLALFTAPVVAMGAWALYVRARVGWPPQEATDITVPFTGLWRILHHDPRYGTDLSSGLIAVLLMVVAILALGLWIKKPTLLAAGALPMALLTFCFGPYVLGRSVNSLRAAAPLLTLTAIEVLSRDALRAEARAPASEQLAQRLRQ